MKTYIDFFNGICERERSFLDDIGRSYKFILSDDWSFPHLPTVAKAAELMGTCESGILNMLSSMRPHVYFGTFLDMEAVEFLADKYVSRFRNYFINYFNIQQVNDEESRDFSTFCKYYSFTGTSVSHWEFIDVDRLRETFIYELTVGTSLFDEGYARRRQMPYSGSDCMKRIVKSLIYHIKLKRRKRQGNKSLMTSLIIANHFHIFSSESGSNNRTNSGKRNANINYPLKAKLSPMAA